MALLIKVNGERSNVDVPKENELKFLQGLVDGYIEITSTAPGSEAVKQGYEGLVCNEEGKLDGLLVNEEATKFAGYVSDVLVGDVLFFKEGEVR